MSQLPQNQDYKNLFDRTSQIYQSGRSTAIRTIQSQLVSTYWEIGKHIVEFEQGGNTKAKYGKELLENLSRDLTLAHGKGFSRSNMNYMRRFYVKYPICETVSHKLGWSHYFELLKISDDLERSFYEKQSILENWSIRELKRQKKPLFSCV